MTRRVPAAALVAAILAVGPLVAGEGWTRADPAYRLSLPRDHASHPDFRIEWRYYTGNAAAADGRRFGYQLTFFRVGVDPAPVNPSAWAVRDLYMAHLAVTDVHGRRHAFAERFNRAGVGWAGAAVDGYRVWNEGWEAGLDDTGRHRLRASADDLGVDLVLEPGKPMVAHGDQGYSRKGSQTGNASHYYSLTRMPTSGRLRIGGETHEVRGLSWMDHEFGTSFLEPGQAGWDWFSFQFEDGREAMLFRMRRADGSVDPHSSGTLVDAAGRATVLPAGAMRFVQGRTWRSPASGAAYPVEWRIEVPARDAVLEVTTPVDAQELRTVASTGVTYWEGTVEVRGRLDGRPVRGRGYLEMTGYTGRPMGEVLR
jgi:predicted secreted hydrolase